jgi:hypothetical protein
MSGSTRTARMSWRCSSAGSPSSSSARTDGPAFTAQLRCHYAA